MQQASVNLSRREFAASFLFFTSPAYPDKSSLLYYVDDANNQRPVDSPSTWSRRRAHILDRFQEVAGPLPKSPGSAPKHTMEEAARTGEVIRYRVAYEAEPGDSVPAWLLVPAAKGRHPAMLCLHQTTRVGKDEPAGLGGLPNLHYAAEFARRGFVALAPDYPNFGDYKIDVYAKGYASATMKGIFNHIRAVDLLSSLPFVDRKRIGVCGHSLGGHNSLFAAAFDPRLRVAVTSCGFTAMPKYMRGDLTGWSHKGYMPRIAERYGKSAARLPFDFPEILGAIAPRAIFINAPVNDSNFDRSGVEDCVTAVQPLYDRIFHARDQIQVRYPDAGHDFPAPIREEAYRFVEQVFKLPHPSPAASGKG